MLNDYKGSPNSRELYPHLIGERITACFQNDSKQVVLIMESGSAVVFASSDATGSPAYWAIPEPEVTRMVDARRQAIETNLRLLRDLPGVKLP